MLSLQIGCTSRGQLGCTSPHVAEKGAAETLRKQSERQRRRDTREEQRRRAARAMPRPRDAKVWNSDLTRAMRTRYYDALATRSSRSFLWQRAWGAVERVSGEIYAFNNGRIVGLPKVGNEFTDTAKQACERIIRGQEPVVPDGMEASDPAATGFEPPVSRPRDHPYLNKMQHRGGGFALLCAFHFHPPAGNRSFHYKSELIRDAQPYCDDAMEPNFWAGRTTTAGWKSIESLERHKLVYRNSMRGARHAAGYNRGPQDEFALTPQGVSFIKEMLKVWPTDRARGGAVTPTGLATPSAGTGSVGNARSAPSTASKKSQEDERELRAWLSNGAAPGAEKRFKVSNARRLHLHRVCNALEQQGYRLRHLGEGSIEPKTLVITVESCPAPSLASGVKRSRSLASMDSSTGHRLGSDDSRSRAATIATPQRAAAEAAEKRMRLACGGDGTSSSSAGTAWQTSAAAAHGHSSARTALEFTDDEEEEELRRAIERSLQDAAHNSDKGPQVHDDVWEVDDIGSCEFDGPASSVSSATAAASVTAADDANGMRLLVDSRERVSNARPRQILDCAHRHLQTAKRNNGTVPDLIQCEVQRASLSLGDYGWLLADGRVSSTVVERKRIGDLVGRSAFASGVAHMEQISRLRALQEQVPANGTNIPGRSFLLLEGDLRQANTQIVWDQTDDDDGTAVDSLAAIYEMIAMLFVENGRSVQVIHSNDEEGTCRLLAQLSVVVAKHGMPLAPNCTLAEFNDRHTKAKAAEQRDEFVKELAAAAEEQREPEPRQLAKMVSTRWSSWESLNHDLRYCSTAQLRSSLLVPSCPRERERWSSVVASMVAARFDPDGSDSVATPARLLSRQVDVSGTDSMIGRLRDIRGSAAVGIRFHTDSSAGVDTIIAHEPVFGWASLQAFGTTRNNTGDRISCSRVFRLVHITGEQLVNYLESSYLDDNCSDYDVADRAARMLMSDLDAMLCANERPRTTELVLFEGVLRECQRCTRGSRTVSDATGNQFNSRLRTLCELAIVLLQHRGDRRSFLSINAPSAGAAGNSVADHLLRALIGVVRDSALLYFNVPLRRCSEGGAMASPSAVRSPVRGTATAAGNASASGHPSRSNHVSLLSESSDLLDRHGLSLSSEDEEEEALLTEPVRRATAEALTLPTLIDLVGDD